MKKIISLLLAAIMVLSAMLSLTACGAPEDSGAKISVYLGGDVFDFDPTDYYVDSNAEQVMSLLYEPLFSVNSAGKLKCAAAKSYSVNEKERTVVIKLRESYWSDEVRVKAEDYIYAWREVLLDPNSPNPASALLYDIENAAMVKAGEASCYELGAVASGTYEITITYREGADYKQLLRNLGSVATSPLRIDIMTGADTFWSKDASTIVTNGPFKIEALNRQYGEFTLSRNMGYHQKSSVTDYTKNVTPASLVSFIAENGELELTYDDIANKTVFYMGDATLDDRTENKNKATVADDLSTYTYVFNTENPLFAIKEVRKALSLALDREAIVEAVTFGKAATGFLPDAVAKSIYGKNPTSRLTSDYDEALSEARALLASVNFTGISKSFTLTVNNDEESIMIASLAEAAWESLGFKVTVKKVSTVKSTVTDPNSGEKKTIEDSAIQALVKEASYGNRSFDVIAVDWQMYSTDAFVALASLTSNMNGNGVDFASTGAYRTNISGWTSADYDSYVNAAFNASTDEERAAALKEAEKILLESAPVIPVIYNQSFAFIGKDLSGIKVDAFGNFILKGAKQKNYQQYLEKED